MIVETIVRTLGSALAPVSAVAPEGSLRVRTKSAEARGHFHGTTQGPELGPRLQRSKNRSQLRGGAP